MKKILWVTYLMKMAQLLLFKQNNYSLLNPDSRVESSSYRLITILTVIINFDNSKEHGTIKVFRAAFSFI